MVITKVLGAAFEVHTHLGPGFLESVYEEALCHELRTIRGLQVSRQKPVSPAYKGCVIGGQRLDLLVEDCLIVALKTVERFQRMHVAQLLLHQGHEHESRATAEFKRTHYEERYKTRYIIVPLCLRVFVSS